MAEISKVQEKYDEVYALHLENADRVAEQRAKLESSKAELDKAIEEAKAAGKDTTAVEVMGDLEISTAQLQLAQLEMKHAERERLLQTLKRIIDATGC